LKEPREARLVWIEKVKALGHVVQIYKKVPAALEI
jgi:hypothetical protein